MPIQWIEENDGKILVVRASGKLVKADYEKLAPEFDRLVRLHGKIRVLFDMVDFHGWDVGAAWEDIKFDFKHFAEVERFAMVGETKWQQRLTTFAKPFTRATVRYFDRSDSAAAHAWLEEGIAAATARSG